LAAPRAERNVSNRYQNTNENPALAEIPERIDCGYPQLTASTRGIAAFWGLMKAITHPHKIAYYSVLTGRRISYRLLIVKTITIRM
jgi:hypothetical protein